MVAREVALTVANARCFSSSHVLNLSSAVMSRNRTLAQLGCSQRAVSDKKRLVRVLATAFAAARLLHDGSLVPASADTVCACRSNRLFD